MNADKVEIAFGDVADSSAVFGWDDRLSPHVEWDGLETWPRPREAWLVWRGEEAWKVTPELVERAWALYRIGVRVSDDAQGDVRALRAHVPKIRSLRVGSGARLTGYHELGRGRMLERLEIRARTQEEVNLSRLRQLRTYWGPATGDWATVLDLPRLEELTLEDDVPEAISAPLRALTLGSSKVRRLPELSLPEKLRRLSTGLSADFDLRSLNPAVGLHDLTVSATRIAGMGTLRSLPLTDLTLEGGTEEDTRVLADLATPNATLWLRAQWSPEVIAAAAEKDWTIKVPNRTWRAALEKAGKPYIDSQYEDRVAPTEFGDVFINGLTLRATFVSDPDDLPPQMSAAEVEARLVPILSARHGAPFTAALRWNTEAGQLLVECPNIEAAHIVAEEAASLFTDL